MKKKNIVITLALIIVALIAAVFLVLKYTSPEKASLPTDQEEQATSSKPLTAVPLVSEKEEGDYYTIDLSYPDVSAPAYSDIKTYVNNIKSEFKQSIPTNTNDAQFENLGGDNKLTLSMKTTVYQSSSTITYKLETYSFTGGAHGGTFDQTFTYGKDGKLITLSNLLSSSDSLNKLSLAARRYLKDKFSGQLSSQEIDAGTEPKIENFSVWYITNEGITFIFGQYQIGPYVFGIQEFPLSRGAAAGILNL